MKTFTLENVPEGLETYQKTATIDAVFMVEPFQVETQEGLMVISPETVDDWKDGYYIAYPSDGSKPYAIAVDFMQSSYALKE